MRIALVSPYSWTYPGRRHAAHRGARRASFVARATTSRARARSTRPTAVGAAAPRRARRRRASCPTGWSRSAARSASRPTARSRTWRCTPLGGRRRCAASCARGGFDVVHLHEPVAPGVGWDALTTRRRAARRHVPLLLGQSRLPTRSRTLIGARRRLNHLHVRIAVSEAAAWTGRRFYGGHYRVIPNGVDAARRRRAGAARRRRRASRCGSSSSARPSSARACRCCCAPSRRCASTCPPS